MFPAARASHVFVSAPSDLARPKVDYLDGPNSHGGRQVSERRFAKAFSNCLCTLDLSVYLESLYVFKRALRGPLLYRWDSSVTIHITRYIKYV